MLRWEPQSIQGREDQGNSSSASCPQTLLLKAAFVGALFLSAHSCRREPAGSHLEHHYGAQAPVTIFSTSCHKGHGGHRAGENKKAPSQLWSL